jgi:hypothetical protein
VTEAEALRRAEQARTGHEVAPAWTALSAERRFIALAGEGREQPAQVRDLLAWVVRFGDDLSWVDLAIDDRTGAVVRVERSR